MNFCAGMGPTLENLFIKVVILGLFFFFLHFLSFQLRLTVK